MALPVILPTNLDKKLYKRGRDVANPGSAPVSGAKRVLNL
jgi:hypothetical protein